MFNLCGRTVQSRRLDCSVFAVRLFNSKRSGCSTWAEYSFCCRFCFLFRPGGRCDLGNSGIHLRRSFWNKHADLSGVHGRLGRRSGRRSAGGTRSIERHHVGPDSGRRWRGHRGDLRIFSAPAREKGDRDCGV